MAIRLSSSFKATFPGPLDARSKVDTFADLSTAFPFYAGQIVYVVDEQKYYYRKEDDSEWEPLELGGSGGTELPPFDSEKTITRNFSAITGKTVSSTDLVDFINNVFFPAVPASISFSVSPSFGEKGVSTAVTFSGSATKNDDVLTSLNIKSGELIVSSAESPFSSVSHVDNFSDNTSFTLELVRESGTPLSTSRTYQSYDPFFVGALDLESIASISGFSQPINAASLISFGFIKRIEAAGTKNYTYDMNGQCACVLYPVYHGQIRRILDQNNFDMTESFSFGEFTYLRPNSQEVPYYILYLQKQNTATNFKYTFSF